MFKGLAVITISAIVLCGCATGYKKMGFSGGYVDNKLQDDVFKVEFRGNGYCSNSRAEDFALLRCAEVALENGYKYFIIIDEKSSADTSVYTAPTNSSTYATRQGNMTYGTTNYFGGQTYLIKKPSTRNLIRCFKEKPEGVPYMVYDAEQVRNSIRKEHGLKL